MIYLLFGEMGIGKNYVGEQLAQHVGCQFFDGDTVVPKTMIEKVVKFRPLSAEDINNYVSNHLIPGIEKRYQDKLVVGQALYREEHRKQIQSHFGENRVKLIWVTTQSHVTHFKRLYSRKDGLKWALYGLYNKPFFQKPKTNSGVHVIMNDQNLEILPQFVEVFNR